MRHHVRAVLGLLMIAALHPVHAEEFNVFGGGTRDLDRHHTSYSYELEYMQPVTSHLAASLGHLNEGHLPDDHRDGYQLQLWGRTELRNQHLTLSAGLGPYWYLDTNLRSGSGAFTDDHGFGEILSLDAAWHKGSRWMYHARANWINAPGSFNSATLSIGAGYLLSSEWCSSAEAKELGCPGWTSGKELTLYGGTEIINSFDTSPRSAVGALEYRRGIARNADWTATLIHENNELLARRTGLMTQVWAVRPVSGQDWRLGLGLGPYVALGGSNNGTAGEPNPRRVCGVISATAARRLNSRWDARLTWNRIFTTDSRDADTILLGLGYSLADPKQ